MPPDPQPADAALLRRTRFRLVAWSGGLTLLLIVLLGALAYGVVATTLADRGRESLAARADAIARVVERSGRPERLGPEFGGRAAGAIAFVLRDDGTTVGDPRVQVEGLPDTEAAAAARLGRQGEDVRAIRISDTPVRVYSRVVKRGGATFVVQVVGERQSEEDLLAALLMVLAVGGAVAVVLASAFGFFYAGRALIPIRASMTRRDAALGRQRDFAANASHELRSPLTVIRTSATALRRGEGLGADGVEALDDITASVDHLAALVDDLLLLARTDSGAVEMERTPLDLADVAVTAVAALTQVATARSVSLVTDPLPAEVAGDPLRLRQLVTILVDNALSHSPPGSTVTVRARPEGRDAVLSVEDEGPGIRADDLPRVFERFWRADNAPPGGTGLGLAIAAWITEHHGGTIRAENRAAGGARFAARIPLGVRAAS